MTHKLALLLLSISVIGCSQLEAQLKPDCQKENEPAAPIAISPYYDAVNYDQGQLLDEPYKLGFRVAEVEDRKFSLILTMDLVEGAFFVSPNCERDFLGKFRIEMDQNDKLVFDSKITETPLSKAVVDLHPFINGEVNWVTEDTKYEYSLLLSTKEDFKVSGFVVFTIEPKCTLEEIPFDLVYADGKLTVQHYPKLDKRTCGETETKL